MSLPSPRALLSASLALVALAACADAPTAPGDAERHARPSLGAAVQAFTGNIRIGIVPGSSEVHVGSTGAYVVRDAVTGTPLLSGAGSQATVTLGSGAVVLERFRLQIGCLSPAGRDALIASAQQLGYVTHTVFNAAANCWRVYVGEFPSNEPFATRNAFRNQAIADGIAPGDSFWAIVVTVIGVTEYRVSLGGATVTSSNPVVVEPESGFLTIEGARYRGVGRVAVNSGGALAAINELPLEEYLYGVVPRELPPNPYGEPEAQKAQAVSARTYALANLGKRAADGYDLLPTTADQVYGGYQAEHPVSSMAVDETAGIVAVSGGNLITTLYHSTSGGWTANSEDVFTNPFSYLRGVPDAERGRALEHVPSLEVFKRHANPRNLRATAEGDFESDWSQYHRWVVDWSAAEMAQVLSASFGVPVSTVTEITVADRSDHGRVREIRFTTDAGTLVGLKDNIRSRLRYIDANGAHAALRSTMFHIEPVTDPRTKATTGWKAWGGGWGHGVGMSQTGAVGMAERGYDFERILKHYYQGIALERWY
ncbi:MAG TPA: SpoIID/LytB domain-containing protein [Gemmatimonadaceae bacterium]|nr:SpoIID/LytB domain-containing protein [Gemmatimonadaceae bacterium]